jgi:type VI protein secretion system component Hcp
LSLVLQASGLPGESSLSGSSESEIAFDSWAIGALAATGFPSNSDDSVSANLASFTKEPDSASQKLFEAVVAGTIFASAKLRESEAGVLIATWSLKDVVFSNYQLAWSSSAPFPVESLQMRLETLDAQVSKIPAPPVGASAVSAGASTTTVAIPGVCSSLTPSSWVFGVATATSARATATFAPLSIFFKTAGASCTPKLGQAIVTVELATTMSSGHTLRLTLKNVVVSANDVSNGIEGLALSFQSITMQVQ